MLYKSEQNKAKQELLENSTKRCPLEILQQYKVSKSTRDRGKIGGIVFLKDSVLFLEHPG